jgi:CBS-domain-containing membrane protein
MLATRRPLTTLTAADLMSRDVVVIPQQMSLRSAANLLSRAQITAAPVIDSYGCCIGVISATDFMHRAHEDIRRRKPQSEECVCSDWQVVEVEHLPTDEVGVYMTPDPVTVRPGMGIRELARAMIDAHIHRVIVVDEEQRPVGVVSSTDVLAAVANSAP